jgi:hypothetical protein
VARIRFAFHDSADAVNPMRPSRSVAIYTGNGFGAPLLVKVVSKTYFSAAMAGLAGSGAVLLGIFQR